MKLTLEQAIASLIYLFLGTLILLKIFSVSPNTESSIFNDTVFIVPNFIPQRYILFTYYARNIQSMIKR